MTIIKNSGYKVKAGIVQNTTGLNLEAGAMVYSIDDASLMVCDGSTWATAGGGGGLLGAMRTQTAAPQFFNFASGGELFPLDFATTVNFTVGSGIVKTDGFTLTLDAGIYSIQLVVGAGSAVNVPVDLGMQIDIGAVAQWGIFNNLATLGGLVNLGCGGIVQLASPQPLTVKITCIQIASNVIGIGPSMSVTKLS